MLYVLYGSDTKKARDKLNSLVQTLLSKKKDATLLRVTGETFQKEQLAEYAVMQGLFEQKSIIVLDSLFADPAHKAHIVEHIPLLAQSLNVFIILEASLDAKTKAALEKQAEKMQECAALEKKETQVFNIFTLADALGERNKKKLWVTYQLGKMHNVSDEEMHGILFWGVKNMLLSKRASDPKQAGLSPFVYKKASSFSKNYNEGELAAISHDLVDMYHRSRRGQGAFEILFERFILSLH